MLERPRKNDSDDEQEEDVDADAKPPDDILTDVFHVQETDKYDPYCDRLKRYSGEYEIPGLPPSVGPCFEEPLPTLPLPSADDDLFGPSSPGYVHEDASPTFEKPMLREIEKTVDDARFIAQHAKNKDKFENVSAKSKYSLNSSVV